MSQRVLLATLAVLAAGVAVWLLLPGLQGDPDQAADSELESSAPGTGGALRAEGAKSGGPAPLRAEGVADERRPDAGAGRTGAGAPDLVTSFERTLAEARSWMAKRRAAKAADDEAAEEAARLEWERHRKALLALIRKDAGRAQRLLAWLGTNEDEDAALYVGRVFPFVFAQGFEGHLIRTAESDAPVLQRRLALIGLRGRGRAAAGAVTRVARGAEDAVLRAQATEEIASHVSDPHAAPERSAMHEVARTNLADPDAGVRRAALVSLLSDRRPLTESETEAVKLRLEDSEQVIRDLAKALLKRQQ